MRILATNPAAAQEISVGLGIDPRAARIRDLSIEGTAAARARPDRFLLQEHVLGTGETAAGILFGTMPGSRGRAYPAGAGEHVLTVSVDIAETIAAGTAVPVWIGPFGDPPGSCVITVEVPGKGATSMAARTGSGLLLVGDSPVPEPEGAVAEDIEANGPGGPQRMVRLRWTPPPDARSIRIERDGTTVGEVSGATSRWTDIAADGGPHRYRIYARTGGRGSFPASARIGTKPGT